MIKGKKRSRKQYFIGRKEVIDFPELGLYNIEAKIDTGAYTTALHCHAIKIINGVLHFKLLDPSHPEYSDRDCVFDKYIQKDIKNSFGDVERRYVITTSVKLGKKRIRSVISLSDRAGMRFPVLIGRKLLKNRFVVDVSKKHIAPLNIVSNTNI